VLKEMLHGLIAQTAGASGGDAGAGGGFGISMLPFVLIFAVFYFLILRPQQKQQQKQSDFVGQLKKGDEVVLQSGFFAKVFEVQPEAFVVELAPNVKVRVLKSSIAGAPPAPQAPKKTETKEEAEKKS